MSSAQPPWTVKVCERLSHCWRGRESLSEFSSTRNGVVMLLELEMRKKHLGSGSHPALRPGSNTYMLCDLGLINHVPSLSLSFPICQIEVMIPPSRL